MVLHVCLAGTGITTNHALVDALSVDHEVSLVVDAAGLDRSPAFNCSQVLVLDAGGIGSVLRPLLQTLRLRRPDLPIVLVDGGLTEADKADAFMLGVLDYFPSPCHIELLAERLQVLARASAVTRVS